MGFWWGYILEGDMVVVAFLFESWLTNHGGREKTAVMALTTIAFSYFNFLGFANHWDIFLPWA